MKATLYSIEGKKKGELQMPKLFDETIRPDIFKKCLETLKSIQPYSPDKKAGKKHSASGTISHKRHDWKGHYGRGISRIPRKTMWRRGTQFYWIGAEISSTRGGRRAHPPKGIGKEKKINKKEMEIAFNSGFAATADEKYVVNRYQTLEKLNAKVPVIIESKLESMKTKNLLLTLKSIFGENFSLVLKNKNVRKGRGKTRGRKYKSNAGLLFVKGSDEKFKMKGIEIKPLNEISLLDFYPLGRLAVYTESAIKELSSVGEKK